MALRAEYGHKSKTVTRRANEEGGTNGHLSGNGEFWHDAHQVWHYQHLTVIGETFDLDFFSPTQLQ